MYTTLWHKFSSSIIVLQMIISYFQQLLPLKWSFIIYEVCLSALSHLSLPWALRWELLWTPFYKQVGRGPGEYLTCPGSLSYLVAVPQENKNQPNKQMNKNPRYLLLPLPVAFIVPEWPVPHRIKFNKMNDRVLGNDTHAVFPPQS